MRRTETEKVSLSGEELFSLFTSGRAIDDDGGLEIVVTDNEYIRFLQLMEESEVDDLTERFK